MFLICVPTYAPLDLSVPTLTYNKIYLKVSLEARINTRMKVKLPLRHGLCKVFTEGVDLQNIARIANAVQCHN